MKKHLFSYPQPFAMSVKGFIKSEGEPCEEKQPIPTEPYLEDGLPGLGYVVRIPPSQFITQKKAIWKGSHKPS